MGNLFGRIRQFKIFAKLPKKNEINLVFSSFSKNEWVIFSGFFLMLVVTTLVMLQSLNKSFMVSVPMPGGSVSEGIIGTPRFINPILAFSDADMDLTTLVYSGLMRKTSDGTLTPDLASGYEVSKDGLTYTFTLKDNITFHNGDPVTPDDVIFTINKAKDPLITSPRSANWDGVSVIKQDERTIVFTLRQPYASFLENTTMGILPISIWGDSPIELNTANTNPVGSGPYMVSKVNKQGSGVIDSFELSLFKNFALGKPFIKKVTLKFYPNEDNMISALENGDIEQISSITPSSATILKGKGYRVESSVLPRIFGLFFNQNQNQLFTDKNIIKAIDQAVDKDQIVREVLRGYGVAIDEPIPPNMIAYQKLSNEVNQTQADRLAAAQNILAKDGWVKGADGFLTKTVTDSKKKKTVVPLEFSISTGNAPELVQSAEIIQKDLEAIGMKVDVKTFEVGNLNQGVIRPRKYDVLLFGQIINHESDLFAFWHSSQRKDPGLNVAIYTNAKVDKILEDAFVTVDEQARIKKYSQFEDEIKKDMPAVFLYSPNFIYVVSKNLQGLNIDHITSPQDRFLTEYKWYTDTDNVWKIFAR
ncbi:MAG: ABC transporter substrate-binding protein [Candidatus Pacebacteria bacterium]|nr:ABC transporter substrate-binding protein [Candidatus Paceibacterota bacterium]